MEQLVSDLKRHNEAYRAGSPLITDAEYDAMVGELRAAAPDHPFLNQVEPEGDFGEGKVRHKTPMLSTDKAYTADEVKAWAVKVVKAGAEIGVRPSEIVFRVTPKLDGMAGKLVDGKLATRGDGLTGNDVSKAFSIGLVSSCPRSGRPAGEEVIGEIVMKQAYFDEHLSEEFAHPRNVVVGAIGADTPRPAAQKALDDGAIIFAAYYTLDAWEGNAKELIWEFERICKTVINCGYPTDGVVIETTHEAIKKHMGSTSHHHNWQIAKKERGEAKDCKVTGVTWQVGRTGRVTPVINIEPTKISGAVVSNVTGHHAGNILAKGIGVGAVIKVIRSGEVIPYLAEVVEKADADVPSTCPCCDHPLTMMSDFLECHGANCSAQVETQIQHWFKTIGNADGFGPGAVSKLVAGGFDSVLKIYRDLDEHQGVKADFGPGQSKNLVEQLRRSQTDRVDDWRFLAAFGIHHLGRGDSKKLLKHVSIHELNTVTKEFMMGIDGFGEVTASSVSEEIAERIGEINAMLALGFNLEITGSKVAAESPITGKHIVFTGGMVRGTRDEMKAHAESLGAIPQSSINKKTQILVAGAKASASKVQKAKDLGAEVYDEDGYLELING